MNFMRSDGRIDAGEDGGSEPPRRLSGGSPAAIANGRARRVVRVIGGGADALVDARVRGTVGGSVSNAVGCDRCGAHRSRRRARRYCPGRSAAASDGKSERRVERYVKRGRENDSPIVAERRLKFMHSVEAGRTSIARGDVDSLTRAAKAAVENCLGHHRLGSRAIATRSRSPSSLRAGPSPPARRRPIRWPSRRGDCRRPWWTAERASSARPRRHCDHRWRNGRARVEAARAAEGNASAGRAGGKREWRSRREAKANAESSVRSRADAGGDRRSCRRARRYCSGRSGTASAISRNGAPSATRSASARMTWPVSGTSARVRAQDRSQTGEHGAPRPR